MRVSTFLRSCSIASKPYEKERGKKESIVFIFGRQSHWASQILASSSVESHCQYVSKLHQPFQFQSSPFALVGWIRLTKKLVGKIPTCQISQNSHLLCPSTAFEGERISDHSDCELPSLLSQSRNNGGSTRSCTSSHTSCDKYKVRI